MGQPPELGRSQDTDGRSLAEAARHTMSFALELNGDGIVIDDKIIVSYSGVPNKKERIRRTVRVGTDASWKITEPGHETEESGPLEKQGLLGVLNRNLRDTGSGFRIGEEYALSDRILPSGGVLFSLESTTVPSMRSITATADFATELGLRRVDSAQMPGRRRNLRTKD